MYGASNAIYASRVVNLTEMVVYQPRVFSDGSQWCSCVSSSMCRKSQGFYCRSCRMSIFSPNYTIPGLVVGCFPVDSVLLSNLECFYNQTCLNMVINLRSFELTNLYTPVQLMNITTLDSNRSSRFLPTTTLEQIIFNLFIENWTTSENFDVYYQLCQPDTCTYILTENYGLITMITMVISYMGGLSVIFRLTLPSVIKILLLTYKFFYNPMNTRKYLLFTTPFSFLFSSNYS